MIVWDEFMPTAAIGAMAIICIPMFVIGVPLYFIGRATMRLMDRLAASPLSPTNKENAR